MSSFLYKLFKLPGPADLGMSDSNHYMSARGFCEPGTLTWEDYNDRLKKEYPVRFFLAETLPFFLKYKIWWKVWIPLTTFHYWLVSHTIRKYHLLDLRQPKGEYDQYRYGWNDVPEKMLYAMFNLLKEYFDEEPADLTTAYSQEEIEADPILHAQHLNYQEAKALLHWWQVTRKEELKKIDVAWDEYFALRHKGIKDPAVEEKMNEVQQLENLMSVVTDSMLCRLLTIRNSLWT